MTMKRILAIACLACASVVSATAFAAETSLSPASGEGRKLTERTERPRLVVATFRSSTGDTIRWCGQAESSAMWLSLLSDKLTERFTQMRKFTMIDRKFDAEIQNEIARLSDKNASKGDVVRLCRRIGTDYMVVGDVRFFTVQPAPVNPLTNQTLPVAPQRFAEIGYRVILAPTGEIEWAATVILSASEFPAADIGTFASCSADGAATRIVTEVMANLFAGESAAATAPAVPAAACPAAPAVAAPGDTTVRGTGNGGVVTPF